MTLVTALNVVTNVFTDTRTYMKYVQPAAVELFTVVQDIQYVTAKWSTKISEIHLAENHSFLMLI